MSASAWHSFRVPLYVGAVMMFALLVGIVAASGTNADPRILYLITLFALCSSPILFLETLNGRHAILCAFLAIYFFFYGAMDLTDLASNVRRSASAPVFTAGELAILAGVASAIVGYGLALALGKRRVVRQGRDWSIGTVVSVGLALWALGAFATWYWQIEILRRSWDPVQGLTPYKGIILTIARLVHPVALALLAYAAAASRSRTLLSGVAVVLAVEFVLGFVSDSKEIAMRGLAILLVAKFLLDGKVPKLWLAAAFGIALLTFPVFQAYRSAVLGERHLERGAAAQELGKNLRRALDSRQLRSGESLWGARSLLERSSLKNTVQTVIDRVGSQAPFQNGRTIGLYFTGFVPRIFWPDKPDSSVGQLFNRELRISEARGTYISPTILGELYWNFAWPGVLAGMAVFGFFLGLVNALCDLTQRRSVTRFLIITATIYLLCVRFEDGIAMTFIVWTRSLAAILVLHLLFARRRERLAADAPESQAHLPLPVR
jgi:hypothetical protein